MRTGCVLPSSVAHDDLTLALGSVAGRISTEVSEAGLQVMQAFGDRGSQITTELARVGDHMVGAMGDRGTALIDRMTITAEAVNQALTNSSELVTGNLTQRAARSPIS